MNPGIEARETIQEVGFLVGLGGESVRPVNSTFQPEIVWFWGVQGS